MASLSKQQWILAGGALAVAVALWLAPRTIEPGVAEEKTPVTKMDRGIAALAEKARAFLPDSLKSREASFLSLTESGENPARIAAYDSLVTFWMSHGQLAIAAGFAGEAAAEKDDPEQWKSAGDLFLMAARNTADESRNNLYNQAISSFETAFKKGYSGLDARVDLGSCYVEGTPESMKGIGIIREVLEADSTNVKALLSLGYFSIRSGQLEKAIERFKRVTELDPEFHDAHVYLGDLYEKTGRTDLAIASYTEFRKHVEDPEIIAQIDTYLDKLKKNNNL